MAEMFPDIEKLGHITSINRSEFEFYKLLKDSPYTKNWKVFYSSVIKSKYKTREVDFIIFIPKEGIVLIELKANNPVRVAFDSFVYNYNGVERFQENPFRKVKNLAHHFKTVFNLSEEEKSKIFVANIVVFPNLSYDFDEKICFDKLNYINSKIKWEEIPLVIYLYFQQKKNKEERIGALSTPDEIDSIMSRIYLDITESKDLRVESSFTNVKQAFTEIKRHLLNYSSFLENFRRVFIEGPASSGKSFFALQHIIQKRSDPKCKIGYVSYGKKYIENMKYSFHKTSNVDIADYLSIDTDLKKQKYDLLILDEFEMGYDIIDINYVDCLVDGGIKNGNLWVMVDPEKKYFDIDSFLESYNFKDNHIKLYINFRNNIAICDMLNRLYEKNLYNDFMMEFYSEITLVGYDEYDFEEKFNAVLTNLWEVERYKPEDIKILTPKSISDSNIYSFISKKRWARVLREYWRSDFKDFICYSNLEDFMGVDSNVVILVDIDETITDLVGVLYKAASRAKLRLVILAKKETEVKIRGYL
ncbi:MAG: NERD domain-containing protein [Elusimicrobiota bacterium]